MYFNSSVARHYTIVQYFNILPQVKVHEAADHMPAGVSRNTSGTSTHLKLRTLDGWFDQTLTPCMCFGSKENSTKGELF